MITSRNFQCSFRSSRSTAIFLTNVADGISEAVTAIALDISSFFKGMLTFFNKVSVIEIVVKFSPLFLHISKDCFVILDVINLQECPNNTRVPQSSILDSSLFLLCISDLHAIFSDDYAFYFTYDRDSDLWQDFELLTCIWP